MDNSKLQDFVTITVLHNRITFGDVRRLQRDYLPHGLASREQVEMLLHLDGVIDRADRAWADWLVSAVFDFAVFSERSVDAVESGTCDWLLDHLAALDISTKVTRRLERDLHQALEPIAPIEYVDEAAKFCRGDCGCLAAAGALDGDASRIHEPSGYRRVEGALNKNKRA